MENTMKMFRKHLLERQITSAEAEILELIIKMKGIMESLHQIIEIQDKLSETLQNHKLKQKRKINKKI